MLVAIITEKSVADIKTALEEAALADVIELRLDYLENIDDLPEVMFFMKKPVIFTLRSVNQLGYYAGEEADRIEMLMHCCRLLPTYVDIESHITSDVLVLLKSHYPSIKIIRSYHHLANTPDDLTEIFTEMVHPACDVYKMVTYANSSLDSFRILRFLKKVSDQYHIAAHAMGQDGIFSRIISPILGGYFHYVHLGGSHEISELGCLSLEEADKLYRMPKMTSNTRIYALIGDPVVQSVGHVFHNSYFSEHDINAVYVKIRLASAELSHFFEEIHHLPFFGFSVTSPLKKMISTHIGISSDDARNTLSIKEGRIHSLDTDGQGALNAIENEKTLLDCHILMIGAGGSASNIAAECCLRNVASITIVNRSYIHAQKIASTLSSKVNVKVYDFQHFEQEDHSFFDVVISVVPDTVIYNVLFIEAVKKSVSDKTIFMDANYYSKGSVLMRELPCQIVSGYEMYVNQAKGQLAFWFDPVFGMPY